MINLYEVLKNYPTLSRQLHCKGMLFTQYECPQTNMKEQFYVQYNYIAYVISGRRIFHKNNKTWNLTEGTCVFVKKGTYTAEKPEGEKWCVMVFFIPDDFLKQLMQENRKALPLNDLSTSVTESVLRLQVNELSESFFYSMLPYFSQTPPPPEHLIELKFKELILSLLSDKSNGPLLAWLNNLNNEKFSTFQEIMENNYTYNLSLKQYATLACQSLSTFKREFRKTFKESPAKWIIQKRLNLAIQLLENTSLSIAEIGVECGFENNAHFSRLFKKKMGASPLQFRMKVQSVTK